MKKIFIFISLLFIPFISASATGISVNLSSVNITKGQSQTINVTVTNLAALMDITTSNSSVASISKQHLDLTSNGSGSVSGSFVITGVSSGSANVTIKTVDATDFTEGNDYSKTITIKVVVNNPTTQPPTQPPVTQPPRVEPQTQPATQPQTQPNVEQPTTTIVPETEPVTETTTAIVDINSNGIDDDIEFSLLKIVGFPINFDAKTSVYSIDVGNVDALYINATALNPSALIEPLGEVDIKDKSEIVINLKNNEKVSSITIKLNRVSKEMPIASPKTDDSKSNKILLYVITFSLTVIVLLILAFIFKERILQLLNKNNSNDVFNSTESENTVNNVVNNTESENTINNVVNNTESENAIDNIISDNSINTIDSNNISNDINKQN